MERDVRVTLDGIILAGALGVPENAPEIVLFAHGSGSSRLSPRNRFVAEALRRGGIGTLLLDESSLFILDCSRGLVAGISAHPTLIQDFQAVSARGARRDAIAARMAALCGELGTSTHWDESRGALRVVLPRPGDSKELSALAHPS